MPDTDYGTDCTERACLVNPCIRVQIRVMHPKLVFGLSHQLS